jgi:hypothetical protein
METQIRFLRTLLATCSFLGIVSACQVVSTEGAAPLTLPTASAESKAESVSGVSGVVIAESDVRGQPDTPLAQQVVVLIPLDVLQGLVGSDRPLTDKQLRFLSVSIKEEHRGLVTGLTDAKGQYALAVPPGAYALCLADSEDADPAGLPLQTRGCGRVVVEPAQVTTADVSSGFREILLSKP